MVSLLRRLAKRWRSSHTITPTSSSVRGVGFLDELLKDTRGEDLELEGESGEDIESFDLCSPVYCNNSTWSWTMLSGWTQYIALVAPRPSGIMASAVSMSMLDPSSQVECSFDMLFEFAAKGSFAWCAELFKAFF